MGRWKRFKDGNLNHVVDGSDDVAVVVHGEQRGLEVVQQVDAAARQLRLGRRAPPRRQRGAHPRAVAHLAQRQACHACAVLKQYIILSTYRHTYPLLAKPSHTSLSITASQCPSQCSRQAIVKLSWLPLYFRLIIYYCNITSAMYDALLVEYILAALRDAFYEYNSILKSKILRSFELEQNDIPNICILDRYLPELKSNPIAQYYVQLTRLRMPASDEFKLLSTTIGDAYLRVLRGCHRVGVRPTDKGSLQTKHRSINVHLHVKIYHL